VQKIRSAPFCFVHVIFLASTSKSYSAWDVSRLSFKAIPLHIFALSQQPFIPRNGHSLTSSPSQKRHFSLSPQPSCFYHSKSLLANLPTIPTIHQLKAQTLTSFSTSTGSMTVKLSLSFLTLEWLCILWWCISISFIYNQVLKIFIPIQ